MAKILYIEDNFDNRILIQRVLMAEGFDVQGADNAKQGIELALSDPPDLILMDINMPEMSGLQATQALRQRQEMRNTSIVALTANVTQDILQETLKAGCDGYITKPVDVDRLPDQVMEYIRKRQQK